MTSERINGETPNGGAYSVAFYLSDAGDPAPKDEATRMVVHEYDSDDRLIFETVGSIERDGAAPPA